MSVHAPATPFGWTADDPWAAVAGNREAVDQLRRAVRQPVHAYLLLGRPGWGTEVAATVFAGELVAATLADDEAATRARTLAAQGRHPAISEVVRDGASISVPQAREIARVANLAPVEGERQVIVLHDFHLVSRAAPTLLKTIEEPPPSTIFVVLADEITDELVTIASRCVTIDFGPVAPDEIADRLVAEGVDTELGRRIATLAAGDLERARVLVHDDAVAARRDFWLGIAGRVDGTGSTAADLVDEGFALIDELTAPYDDVFARERAELDAAIDAGHATRSTLTQAVERHKRTLRRVRSDELVSGLATIAESYRRGVVEGRVGADEYRSVASDVVVVADRLTSFNANERTQLLALIVSLPAVGNDDAAGVHQV